MSCGEHDEEKYLMTDGSSDPFSGIPASLLSSKHAPPLEELFSPSSAEDPRVLKAPTVSPLSMPGRETPGSLTSSPSSTMSNGDWRASPSRIQYLAKYIKPGNSLNETERAAVEVWKEASKVQLHWEEFRQKCNCTRHVYMDPTEPIAFEERIGGSVDVEEKEIGVEEVEEEKAGITKKWCYGKDLTAVLAEIRTS